MKNKYLFWTISLITLLTGFRLFYINRIELSNDEAYYYTWSRHLSFGYYDSGPALGWIIRLFTDIFGHSEFSVRLGSVLLSLAFNILFYFFLKKLLDEKRIFYCLLMVNFIPGVMIGSILMMHDSIMIFFWLAGLYSLYSAFIEKNNWGYFWAGLSFGFGLWGKDTMLFLPLCFAIYFILDRVAAAPLNFQKIISAKIGLLKNKYFYLIIGLGILIFLPVIIWNFENDFPTYKHIFELGTRSQKGSLVSPATFFDFIGSQLGLISPFIFALLFYSAFKLWRAEKTPQVNFLLLFSIPVVVAFSLLSFTSKVEGNWSGFGYIALMPLPFMLYRKNSKKLHRYFFAGGVAFCIFLDAIVFFPEIMYYLAPRLPVLRNRAVKLLEIDRTNEVHGWRQLADSARKLCAANKKTFLFTTRYQTASSLEFYTKHRCQVFCFPLGRRYNQYDITAGYGRYKGYDGIFINENPLDGNGVSSLMRFFDSVSLIREITVYRPFLVKDPIRRYFAYKCINFNGSVKSLKEMRAAGGTF